MIALEFTRPPSPLLVEKLVRRALEEDLGRGGDITSDLTIAAGTRRQRGWWRAGPAPSPA